jgi:hypothetical protein
LLVHAAEPAASIIAAAAAPILTAAEAFLRGYLGDPSVTFVTFIEL